MGAENSVFLYGVLIYKLESMLILSLKSVFVNFSLNCD